MGNQARISRELTRWYQKSCAFVITSFYIKLLYSIFIFLVLDLN